MPAVKYTVVSEWHVHASADLDDLDASVFAMRIDKLYGIPDPCLCGQSIGTGN